MFFYGILFYMNMIRPVVDLENNLTEIADAVHESGQPVFLTKDGFGDMVLMSMEAFEALHFENETYAKLLEAEKEAALTEKRFSGEEVLSYAKNCISRNV